LKDGENMRKIGLLTLALLTAFLGLAVTTSADAQPQAASSVQSQIAQLLHAHPGGVQISPTQIAWHGGSVVLTLSAAGSRTVTPNTTWHGCPSGWYCFYQNIDFNQNTSGRMLQFQDCTPGGTIQYFSTYGFRNETSSWVVNRSLNFVNVNDTETGYNLWNEPGNSSSSWVGSANNDRADWFICYS
jgi:peptidase inhibitor family I36